MPELKGLRCPACGAPVSGAEGSRETSCVYCGSGIRIEEKKSGEPEIVVIRPKRNALDIILIVLGSLWVLLVVSVIIYGRICRTASEFIAGLLLCSPGIVLLLIGFRRKKATILRNGIKQ